jgi:hypothetical protein
MTTDRGEGRVMGQRDSRPSFSGSRKTVPEAISGGPDTSQRCTVRLGFVDINNQAVGNPDDFPLAPGRGAFLDLDARSIGDPGLRGVRPVVHLLTAQDGRLCQVVPSAVAFDAETGVPTIFMSPEPHL